MDIKLDYSNKTHMLQVAKALANDARIDILEILNGRSMSVNEIAETLHLPTSTAALNVRILEEAGLLLTENQPGIRGSMKVSSRICDRVEVQLLKTATPPPQEHVHSIHMPIGNYSDCSITPTCGLVNEKTIISIFDQPDGFYTPERTTAQLLWFFKGYVEYRFPQSLTPSEILTAYTLSFEACSEAPFYRNDWPSDITVWVNGHDIGTWTSPGDFGGRRGRLNPSWWPEQINQYGHLKTWSIRRDGTYLDGEKISETTLAQVQDETQPFISIRIGIKENARNIGGVSIFGEAFGDHPQNIILTTTSVSSSTEEAPGTAQ